MTVDERTRHQLYLSLEDKLGNEEAQTLMELLPPVGWADVATKQDLAARQVATSAEFDSVRAEFDWVRAEFDSVRTEFDSVRTEFVAVRADIRNLEERLTDRIDARIHKVGWTILASILGTQATTMTGLVAIFLKQ